MRKMRNVVVLVTKEKGRETSKPEGGKTQFNLNVGVGAAEAAGKQACQMNKYPSFLYWMHINNGVQSIPLVQS